VGRTMKAALAVAATVTMAAALAELTAGPALATYRPPSIREVCTSAANNGILEGTLCVLPAGQTTAPNSYSATIAVAKTGAAGAAVTFALSAGSLPPGLTMPAQSGPGTVISGNPTRAGTFNFTVKATDGGLTATLAYQITITVQGPPDQLLCNAANGSYLISGVCVLPDAVVGVPYQGHLPTAHSAGGTLSVVAGSLPPGLSLSASFGPSGAIIGGTPGQPGVDGGSSFTLQGTGDQGQPLYQAYSIAVDQNQPLTIVPPSGGSALSPGMVGQAYFGQDFFLSGGAAPYAWSVTAGQLPPGMFLQTTAGPRDTSNELAGTPTATGTYTFTMRLADFDGQQATQQFSLTVDPPLQISTTPLAAGTAGVPYSHDLIAQGGAAPYSWFVVTSISELPPGLTLGTTAPDFNNVLTGTPTKAGTFTFPMQVQDSQDNTATGMVTITIKP
jgi:large repetitive protein